MIIYKGITSTTSGTITNKAVIAVFGFLKKVTISNIFGSPINVSFNLYDNENNLIYSSSSVACRTSGTTPVTGFSITDIVPIVKDSKIEFVFSSDVSNIPINFTLFLSTI